MLLNIVKITYLAKFLKNTSIRMTAILNLYLVNKSQRPKNEPIPKLDAVMFTSTMEP